MNYTKGEWNVEKLGDGMWEIFCKDYLIASSGCPETIGEKNESITNAHLIASAPDMYEALKLWTQHNQGTRGHYCSECATAIEKALAKAGGGKP